MLRHRKEDGKKDVEAAKSTPRSLPGSGRLQKHVSHHQCRFTALGKSNREELTEELFWYQNFGSSSPITTSGDGKAPTFGES